MSQDASRGFTDLGRSIINHTRSLSLNTAAPAAASSSTQASREAAGENTETTPTAAKDMSSEAAIKESETVLSRLRGEAAKRLKDLQRAEDAADEALLRFGSNLRDFFRDAIQIAPPSGGQAENQGSTVLFESVDAHGKRVIHTSRFDAQLHVIHTTTDNFMKDGTGPEFEAWAKEFDIEKKTEDISGDLAKYPELRATMEKLVPDQVPYADFWKRYYFLRHGIETAEARRRDLLKGREKAGLYHFRIWLVLTLDKQPHPPKRKSAGTRTRMTRPSPANRQQPRTGPAPPSHQPPSNRRPPARASLSRPSPASPTMRSRRRTVTRATTSSAPLRACPARHPTARRRRARSKIATRRIGSRCRRRLRVRLRYALRGRRSGVVVHRSCLFCVEFSSGRVAAPCGSNKQPPVQKIYRRDPWPRPLIVAKRPLYLFFLVTLVNPSSSTSGSCFSFLAGASTSAGASSISTSSSSSAPSPSSSSSSVSQSVSSS